MYKVTFTNNHGTQIIKQAKSLKTANYYKKYYKDSWEYQMNLMVKKNQKMDPYNGMTVEEYKLIIDSLKVENI